MQITDKSSYVSEIYSAIVVNADTDLDPKYCGRVQIYIPKAHYNYMYDYQSYAYLDSEEKVDDPLFNVFPWAKTLVDDLSEGDYVFGSYIDNDPKKFIILGIDNNPEESYGTNYSLGSFKTVVTNLNDISKLTDLALAIITHNEIGVDINAWKNNSIPDSKYSTITLHDGGEYDYKTAQWIKQGCWSIGLLQWNGPNAYNTIYRIIRETSNWESYFYNVNSGNGLYTSIKQSLANGFSSGQSGRFGIGYNPEVGSAIYNSIKSILLSSESRKVQNKLAYDDIYDIMKDLFEQGCNNPAILIFITDFFNQYGRYNYDTIKKCIKACTKDDLTTMEQLDWVIDNQLKKVFSDYNKYKNRRNTTYDYVEELLSKGKLGKSQLTDEDGYYGGSYGKYSMPFEGNAYISAVWGEDGYPTYTHIVNGKASHYHTGVDFAFATGRKLYASASGTISVLSENNWTGKTAGWGMALQIMTDDGKMIIYAHMSKFVKRSGRVNKGELIGYSGNTGNSTGDHLHFEIRKSPYRFGRGNGDDINPLPLLGLKNVKANSYLFK